MSDKIKCILADMIYLLCTVFILDHAVEVEEVNPMQKVKPVVFPGDQICTTAIVGGMNLVLSRNVLLGELIVVVEKGKDK